MFTNRRVVAQMVTSDMVIGRRSGLVRLSLPNLCKRTSTKPSSKAAALESAPEKSHIVSYR